MFRTQYGIVNPAGEAADKKMVDGKGGNLKTIHHSKLKGVLDDPPFRLFSRGRWMEKAGNLKTIHRSAMAKALSHLQSHSGRKKRLLLFRSFFPSAVSGRSSSSSLEGDFPPPSPFRVRKKSYSWIRPGRVSASPSMPQE